MLVKSIHFYVLLIAVYSFPQLILYNTDQQMNTIIQLHHDCLYYEVDDKIVNYGIQMKLIFQIIPYCIRPLDNETNINIINDTNEFQAKTFEQLQQLNITNEQLLLWSAPIDVAERYQIYLNNQKIYIKIFFE
ncbi:unnamed protein product [Rotaria sp. Silwood2]|nr:unnamed protein product [Rotaria sp. Silwood2]